MATYREDSTRVYKCRKGKHLTRLATIIDRFVEELVIDRVSRDDARELLVDNDRPDLDALRTDALALRSRLDTLAVEWADGEITSSQRRTASDRMLARLADVEAQMAHADRTPVLADLIDARDPAVVWHGWSVERQREALRVLLPEITILKGRVGGNPVRRTAVDPASLRWSWLA